MTEKEKEILQALLTKYLQMPSIDDEKGGKEEEKS